LARDLLCDAAPLLLIRLDEWPSRHAVDEVGQLPHRVVHSLKAGVDPEPPGRRELVCGVAAQEHAALDESLDDGGIQLPEPERQDLRVEVVVADGGADPVPGAGLGEDVERPVVGLNGDLTESATGAVERLQDSGRADVRHAGPGRLAV
jgi:hypothetical protein